MTKQLYVAATNQHVGKTTCTLGLVEAFRQMGQRVAYCKPVGQGAVDFENLQVDKDALLFSTMMHFDLVGKVHSPVILGPGATQRYLDNPGEYAYRENVQIAARILESEYEMVVYEGTGHPGVGSVVGLSNADVAKMIGAPVILVVEGGVGFTIDRINLCLSLFREQDVHIAGVIINKVLPEKLEKVCHYVGMKLDEWGIPLLGALPYDKTLMYPLLDSIRKVIQGRVIANPSGLNNLVENVVAGSLLAKHNFEEEKGVLLVVSKNRLNASMERIVHLHENGDIEQPLSGIVITGDGRFEEPLDDFAFKDFVFKHNVPLITTPLDTYGTAVQISKMEIKINVQTVGKVKRAIELIKDHVDFDKISWQSKG
ncbi:MAG: AAA family ATPase [Saprospiraceae bacterium]